MLREINIVGGSEQHHRNVRRHGMALDFRAGLPSVQAWHHHVEHDQIGALGNGQRDAVVAARCGQNAEIPLEDHLVQVTLSDAIVDQKHLGRMLCIHGNTSAGGQTVHTNARVLSGNQTVLWGASRLQQNACRPLFEANGAAFRLNATRRRDNLQPEAEPGVPSRFAILLAVVALAACTSAPQESASPAAPIDIHSFARAAEARVTHVALDLRADMQARQLSGTATLTIDRRPGASEIVLDTRDLEIERVADSSGTPLKYAMGGVDPVKGRPLTVTLPASNVPIVITYRTDPAAAALQWLTPEQTAGKRLPYLFSQGQAILTRTWIPTQDSPGIRQTYSARIAVPPELHVVMSAESLTPEAASAKPGEKAAAERVFEFRLTQPIPPYLIALAVGDIASRSISPRTAVYAEPPILDRAAFEFADLERMVQTAESLLGAYRWGRYDLLVLPPSFPFGGMENPRLTFATPTVIAGDRSLVSLVAHELAHSWSGNLVTNATWSDFWLNEGVTTYVERRIMEALYTKERADMLRVIGRRELQAEVTRLGGPKSPDTILHVDLTGRDPDEGATEIPYEKGAALFDTIEAVVGRDRFDGYLRSYFDRHAFQPITSAAFLEDLRSYLLKGDAELERRLRLDEWIYQPGVPDNAVAVTSAALDRAAAQSKAFAGGTPAASLDTAGWATQQWQYFLDNLPEKLSPAQLSDLDRAHRLTSSGNSEILFSWLRIAIRSNYRSALPAPERFLTTQGRRKFLRPLYEDLMATDWGKAEARRIYARARPLYHTVATSTLDPIVK
jgi:leukotriene-A4 hydrolase